MKFQDSSFNGLKVTVGTKSADDKTCCMKTGINKWFVCLFVFNDAPTLMGH